MSLQSTSDLAQKSLAVVESTMSSKFMPLWTSVDSQMKDTYNSYTSFSSGGNLLYYPRGITSGHWNVNRMFSEVPGMNGTYGKYDSWQDDECKSTSCKQHIPGIDVNSEKCCNDEARYSNAGNTSSTVRNVDEMHRRSDEKHNSIMFSDTYGKTSLMGTEDGSPSSIESGIDSPEIDRESVSDGATNGQLDLEQEDNTVLGSDDVRDVVIRILGNSIFVLYSTSNVSHELCYRIQQNFAVPNENSYPASSSSLSSSRVMYFITGVASTNSQSDNPESLTAGSVSVLQYRITPRYSNTPDKSDNDENSNVKEGMLQNGRLCEDFCNGAMLLCVPCHSRYRQRQSFVDHLVRVHRLECQNSKPLSALRSAVIMMEASELKISGLQLISMQPVIIDLRDLDPCWKDHDVSELNNDRPWNGPCHQKNQHLPITDDVEQSPIKDDHIPFKRLKSSDFARLNLSLSLPKTPPFTGSSGVDVRTRLEFLGCSDREHTEHDTSASVMSGSEKLIVGNVVLDNHEMDIHHRCGVSSSAPSAVEEQKIGTADHEFKQSISETKDIAESTSRCTQSTSPDVTRCSEHVASFSGGMSTALVPSRNSCKMLKCPKCNWHYKYQETLEIHMKEKHPEADIQCVYCSSGQNHPRLARGEAYTCGYKPYRCEVCSYSTTTKGNLSIHMQSDRHMNNVQEMQNGLTEIPTQPPVSPSLGNSGALKKERSKPAWKCEICNYETSVARNLRIHMTSEKHAHNLLILQQGGKPLPMDIPGSLNNSVSIGRDPVTMMLAGAWGIPGVPPFPFDQKLLSYMPQPLPVMLDNPVDLAESELMPSMAKNDHDHLYQCTICNAFATDSMDALCHHAQLDRTMSGGEQEGTVVVSGTYLCNLCQYKTTLKANFQLHCKTDKHLQRLQLVNHIREGGAVNEWRFKYASPTDLVVVRCNACDVTVNSIHKLQVHSCEPHHAAATKIFQHILRKEISVKGESKFYQCVSCQIFTASRTEIIQHFLTVRHCRDSISANGELDMLEVVKHLPDDSQRKVMSSKLILQ